MKKLGICRLGKSLKVSPELSTERDWTKSEWFWSSSANQQAESIRYWLWKQGLFFFFFPRMKRFDTRNIKLIQPCLHLPLAESNSQEDPRSRNTGSGTTIVKISDQQHPKSCWQKPTSVICWCPHLPRASSRSIFFSYLANLEKCCPRWYPNRYLPPRKSVKCCFQAFGAVVQGKT